MKRTFLHYVLVCCVFFATVGRVGAQVVVHSSDSLSCTVLCTTLSAVVTGDAPTNSGISIDDRYSAVHPIGFPFNFYGTIYNDIVIGPNGTLCFDLSLAGAYDPWPITAVLLGNPSKYNNICGPWCDIDISIPGGGTITYSLTGIAPFRKYIVTFCNDAMFSCTTQRTSTQIILYETTNIIECHIATKPVCAGWNGGRAIIGVQNATGTAATVAPGRDFPSVFTCTNEAWRFTPDATVSSYSVASIPYAPVPYASSLVYWFNATTGAYIGTGSTITVCPTTTTTYRAGALGCADTSFGYYTVTPAPSFTISLTPTNPTRCESCDGSITISGLLPGVADTITYTLGGVPQPTVIGTASPAGTHTITGLCAGTYDNFIGRQGLCASLPAGPVTLVDPSISISSVTQVNPLVCGACDGQLIIAGLYPSHIFTINYTKDGVAQPPFIGTTDASGTITLSGLCEGVYSGITASYGTACVTPPMGPYTLVGNPPPPAFVVNIVNPSECGLCDGSITIRSTTPFSSDTVSYSLNGVPQPPFVTVAAGDSSIFIPGLCSGTYSGFSIKIGNCVTTVIGGAVLTDPPLDAYFDTTFRYACSGDTVFFHNHSTSTGPLHYVWDFGDGQTDTATNPYHVYGAGTYTVRLLATNHACSDTMTMTFTLGHPLEAIFAADPIIVCQNDPVAFANTSIGATGYEWSFGDGATDVTATPTHAYQNTGQYKVQLIASNTIPCYDTAYATIQVDTISGVKMSLTDTVICAGTYVTLTGHFAELGNTGTTWTFGDNGETIKNVNPVYHAFNGQGTYTVTVNAHYRACPDISTTRTITIFARPTANIGEDTSICKGSEAITLGDYANANNPLATWLWNTGERTRTIRVGAPGNYYVKVTVNNCETTDSVLVSDDCYVHVPNIFTPNGDGVNDYFFPRQLLAKGLTKFSMAIYNRWGQTVFEASSLNGSGWDGRLNGVEQPEGVYIYTMDAEFRDGQHESHKGNVTLMR
jgi:gliding motility-associated-like protein